MRRSRKSRPTWRPFWIEPSQCGRGLSRASEVVFGICVNAVHGCFCPLQIFFCFLRPGQLHYLAGCDRRQGRAFFRAFIGAKRKPFTAGAAGLIEDHPGRRKLGYTAPAVRMRSCHSIVPHSSSFSRSSLLSLLKLNGRIHAAWLLSAL